MTSLSRLTFTMRRVFIAKGFWGLVNAACSRLLHTPVTARLSEVEHPFDARYGVCTAGLGTKTGTDQREYYGINPSVFRGALQRWMATLPPSLAVAQYSFVDLGSGLGRALLLASELPFREVVGVEVGPDLVEGSRHNIETWVAAGHARAPIRVLQHDALEFEFPQEPLLVFLYNPFGENTLLQVLARLTSGIQVSGPIDILYCHPKHGYVFDRKSQFRELWMEPIPLDDEDRSADAFASKVEVCALYRRMSSHTLA